MFYLNVGTNYIYPEAFINIKNTDGSKPQGGFWATEHNRFINYNLWLDYICSNPYIIYQKKIAQNSLYTEKAVYFKLIDNANILFINDIETLEFVLHYYPDGKGWIDFEKLAEDYSGLEIKVNDLLYESKNEDMFEKLKKFAITSLILFTPDCIEYFQKAKVTFSPFDPEYPDYISYDIEIDEQKYYIGENEEKVIEIVNEIASYIKAHNLALTLESYAKIVSLYLEKIKEAESILQSISKTENDLQVLLIRKAFNQS